jgi:hypothetical protein
MTWRDKRGPGWSKRARIYCAPEGSLMEWRVELIDTTHQVNVFVPGKEQALQVVKSFEDGLGAVTARDQYEAAT